MTFINYSFIKILQLQYGQVSTLSYSDITFVK